jgi:hypothetical protein
MKISKQVEKAIETICDEYEDVAIYLHDSECNDDFIVTESFGSYNFLMNILNSCVNKMVETNDIPINRALASVIENLCDSGKISDNELLGMFNNILKARIEKYGGKEHYAVN